MRFYNVKMFKLRIIIITINELFFNNIIFKNIKTIIISQQFLKIKSLFFITFLTSF